MNNFIKIPLDFSGLDISKIVSNNVSEGYGDHDEFRSYIIQDLDYFLNFCKDRVEFTIPPTEINYTEIKYHGAEPHSEPTKTVLNYYIDAAKSATVFWKPKNTNYEPIGARQLLPNGPWVNATTLLWDQRELNLTDYFIAKTGEAYLIRTEQIHSVVKGNNEIRKFIRWLWLDVELNDVLNSIKIIK